MAADGQIRTVLAIGDSITEGLNASATSARWVEQLGALLLAADDGAGALAI